MDNNNEWYDWEVAFLDRGISPEYIEKYRPYIDKLLVANLPIIFEFEHLAKLLGVTRTYLASAVNGTNAHYRGFTIPKRRGGIREIFAPYPALLECQRWINLNILSRLPVHDAAHGFIKNRSIITNASHHLGSNLVLTMDLKDFFPSINLNQVMQIFIQIGYANNVAFYLASLCTLDSHLPQGAATSPMLSNIIAYHFDNRISKLAIAYNLKYTRYADDLTFSGTHISQMFRSVVEEITNECGFELNEEKTKFYRSPKRKMVTGLVLRDDGLTLPRHKKRELSKDVYYIREYGFLSHISKRNIRDPLYLERLIGKCSFWLQVEPDNSKVQDWMKHLVALRREFL